MKHIKVSDKEIGRARTYHVSGNDTVGYRLALPQKALKSKIVSGVYRCIVKRDGTLVYQPVKP